MIEIIEDAITGLFKIFFVLGIVIGLLVWGVWSFIDWMWLDEVIKSHHVISPALEVTIKNGVTDTLYIYRLP